MTTRVRVASLLLASSLCGCGAEPRPAQPEPETPQAPGSSPVVPKPCTMTHVYADADGDGHPASSLNARSVCAEDGVDDGFILLDAPGERDCDDADPTAWQSLCGDDDGDGAVSEHCVGDDVPAELHRCPIVLQWTPEPGPYDCDDQDPEAIDYFYVDQDGDGYGAGESACLGEQAGYSAWPGDCADDDATRYPGALEAVGDGVDADCDGSDWGGCGAGLSLREFDWPDASQPAACDGPDLALGVLSCSGCQTSSATFAVENRGSERFVGDVVLTELESGTAVTVAVDLAPNEQRALISGPFRFEYELGFAAADLVDCDAADNRANVRPGHCI